MRPTIGVLLPGALQVELISPKDRDLLNSFAQVHWNDRVEHLTEDEAAAFLQDCEIAVGSWGTPKPSAKILDACPKLRLWEHAAGSVKQMFGPHLAGHELIIASCAPAIALNVAEMTLGQLIVGVRKVFLDAQQNRAIYRDDMEHSISREEAQARRTKLHSRSLGDVTVGVLGASQVGRRVLEFLQPFYSRVLLYDPYVSSEEARSLGTEKVDSVNELCQHADAVTIHTPVLPETTPILGSEQFRLMKDDTVIINTARGKCLDEKALIEELWKGRFFAFLDVSEPEPAAVNSPLRHLPNVVYTTHLAGGRNYKIGAQMVSDIQKFLNGESPLMAVTPDMLGRIA